MATVEPFGQRRHSARSQVPPTLALTRAGGVQPLLRFLSSIGAPIPRIMRTAGFAPQLLDDPDSLIPLQLAHRLTDVAAQSQGITDLGLVVAARTSAFDVAVLGPELRQAVTIYDYLQTGCRLIGALCSGERFWLTLDDDVVRFHHLSPGGTCTGRDQEDLYCMAVTLRMLRAFVGDEWCPSEIYLMTSDSRMLGDGSFIGDARLKLGQPSSSFTMPFDLLQRPVPHADGELEMRTAGTGAVEPAMPDDFLGSVEALIGTLLIADCLHMDTLAEAAGLSTRTLQRRLQDYRLSYSDIVRRTRLRLAREWLARTAMPVAEIAVALGYRDAANFTRAFRIATGIPPTRYRASYA